MSQEVALSTLMTAIIQRTQKYNQMLKFPHEGTERMIRGWIALEMLHDLFQWPSENIVFGETFDLLLVDNLIRPVIYLETKSISYEIDLDKSLEEINKILLRTGRRPTLNYLIITNGIKWMIYNVIGEPLSEQEINDIRNIKNKEYLILENIFNVNRYMVNI